jgi:hypothetical protein
MQDEMKAVGVVAAIGAAAGAGLALGVGLRFFSVLAMVGLGTGVALGLVASGKRGLELSREPEAPSLFGDALN